MSRPRRRQAAAPRRWVRSLRRLLAWLVAILLLLPPLTLAAYRYLPPPVTPLMLIRLAEGESLTYRFRPLDQISPALARAVIASEDNLFCEHWGFDLAALRTELERAWAGERPRGASTISQQLAKNLFLWPGRDFLRKILETWLAPQIELILGKRRLLELYLNVAELGPGIYGAEAASRHWLDKPAAALSAREAARIAIILPAPRSWTPSSDWATKRSAVILQRVEQLGPLLDCAS